MHHNKLYQRTLGTASKLQIKTFDILTSNFHSDVDISSKSKVNPEYCMYKIKSR